ncbi:MAG: zinc ribbon domain-containing protein [Lachnospiraceae bacterium]|nr:zinc ribbon domain-containing protein [Lachnospiraceae bacterium]
MICGNCGTFVQDGVSNCPNCGAPMGMNPNGMDPGPMGMNPGGMGQGPMGMNPNGVNGAYAQPRMSRKQFYKDPAMKTIRSNLITCGVVGYVLATLNIVLSIFVPSTGAGLLDGLVILGFSLGLHLGKSRVCAILLTLSGVFNMIVMFLLTQQIYGWLIPLLGIDACIYTFKFHAAWKKYTTTGLIDPK